jgi:hypothetical protein
MSRMGGERYQSGAGATGKQRQEAQHDDFFHCILQLVSRTKTRRLYRLYLSTS